VRNFFIYLAGLTVSSAVVFLLFFGLGRSPSLEQEMARRAYQQRGDRSLSIPSLKPAETEEPVEEEALPPPEVSRLTEEITVSRFPLDEGGVLLLLDPELVSRQPGGIPPHADFRRGLEDFLREMPSSFLMGMRALAAEEEGSCGETIQLLPLGSWSPDELLDAAERGRAGGPRNISGALESAAADLGETIGEQAIIILTAGEERCGGSPCQTAALMQEMPRPAPTFVVLLNRAGSGGLPGQEIPPPWLTRVECIAERGGGEFFQVSTALELKRVLLRIVTGLQPNVTIRVFHSEGREISGTNVEDRMAWGAVMTPVSEPQSPGIGAASFPAALTLPAGAYNLRLWYGGSERTVENLDVPSGKRVEIEANFRAGEFYLQSKDSAGQELVGDTGDLDCFWGTEVFQKDDMTRDYGASCAFPAYFVLEPGTYTVRAWKGASETWVEDVVVTEGETVVKTVVFAEEQPKNERQLDKVPNP
jgi:hypothetical protein